MTFTEHKIFMHFGLQIISFNFWLTLLDVIFQPLKYSSCAFSQWMDLTFCSSVLNRWQFVTCCCVTTNPRKTLSFLVFVYFFMEQSKSPVPPANRPNLRPFFLARPQFSLPAFTHTSTSNHGGQRLLIIGIIINFGASIHSYQ